MAVLFVGDTGSRSCADRLVLFCQKWKAFVKELEAMQKKFKKKDAAGALEIFNSATVALEGYLSEVDLPPIAELK